MSEQPVVLLLEAKQGNYIGIRFRSRELARNWEDSHPKVTAMGCVDLVTQTRAVLDHGVEV